ncbi:XdhC family protein [Lederbergia citrea]|uniref:XdhC family protein n=1 Tax=Lederbergia citrea TaxID=2833581 RepID=UPI001BC96ECB|nr:XdhC family protein [Lederbergia citrea]MBS4178938.1 XdhC family protein [Lederbergia citrea]MBS4205619.1 XdhC family protein [Lederbergia citrea]
MISFHELVKEALTDHQPAVLATIIHVDGSAYRKEGACMLVKQDGSRVGLLSGGCLESDVYSRAQEIFDTGKAEIYRYDLSAEDDLGWGTGAGCNGIISVLVRDIDLAFRQSLTILIRQLEKIEPILFIQSVSNVTKYIFINESGDTFGHWQGDLPIERKDILQFTPPFHQHAGMQTNGEEAFYFQVIWPQPNLYIIGAGEDARPLAQLAGQTGYAVHMLDWREALCSKLNFPTANSLYVGNIEETIQNIAFHPLDSVVIMTHDFQRDMKILQYLKKLPFFYIGILGSRKRTERVMDGQIPPWLQSPVGLSIGAEGPEEIAVSIVAELIAARRRNE